MEKERNIKQPGMRLGPYRRNLGEIEVPNDVEIPKIKLHDDLNPKVWDAGQKLKPEVRKALIRIAKQYYEFLEIDKKIKDIIFTGSLANFNWTSTSDIDVHLTLDYGDLDEDEINFLDDFLYMKKKIWNESHDIKVKGFEVEVFAKDREDQHTNKAIYSLVNDSWIVPPTKDMPAIDEPAIKRKAAFIMNQIEDLGAIESLEDRYNEAGKIKDKIKTLRDSLKTDGEYSEDNLVFKALRNSGHMDILSDIKGLAYDTMMSLDENLQEYEDIPTHTLKVQKGIEGMTDEKVDIIKDFMGFACHKLNIGSAVSVCLRKGRDEYITTTASYVPSDNENHIRCEGRALIDILGSIGHELTHNRQREMGKFKIGEAVQNIGGHLEDEANSMAGILKKDFTHNYGYDHIYDL